MTFWASASSMRIFTGMRWTTFTKLPTAFSGGSRLMREPVEPAIEYELLVRMDRAQAVELRPVGKRVRRAAVEQADGAEGRPLTPAAGGVADAADDRIAGAQPELPDDPRADVHVSVARQVVGLAPPEESGAAVP